MVVFLGMFATNPAIAQTRPNANTQDDQGLSDSPLTPSTPDPVRTADTIAGRIGQRATREQVSETLKVEPIVRIKNRISSRIENRINNVIDNR